MTAAHISATDDGRILLDRETVEAILRLVTMGTERPNGTAAHLLTGVRSSDLIKVRARLQSAGIDVAALIKSAAAKRRQRREALEQHVAAVIA